MIFSISDIQQIFACDITAEPHQVVSSHMSITDMELDVMYRNIASEEEYDIIRYSLYADDPGDV